jgi:hypothetical protein
MESCPRSANNRGLDASLQCGYSRLEALLTEQPCTDGLQAASSIISNMFDTVAALKAGQTGRERTTKTIKNRSN